MSKELERLIDVIRKSRNIVFFGGAGVSTASNIPDFRSSKGLFNERLNSSYQPEELVSHTFYKNHPEEFFEYYKKRLIYPNAKPNNCHFALVKLEQMGKLKAIITQNVDGLHQKAGSKRVYELHGSVHRNYCTNCHALYDANFVIESVGIPRCIHCKGIIKPDVVLYEESLDEEVITNSVKAIADADTLIIGGTSLAVYPAAGLINYFKGSNMVLINKTITSADHIADIVFHECIDQILYEVVDKL